MTYIAILGKIKVEGKALAEGVFNTYWFGKNMQGDIVAVYDNEGIKLVTYTYDAWGKQTVTYSNGGASTPVSYNRIRYRGYYYDTDLYLYYLGSRYYDANTCRFINADDSLYHSMLGYNMFAYCKNNPIRYIDPTGQSAISLEELLLYYMTTGAAIAIAEPTPVGEIIYVAGGLALLGTVCLVSLTSSEVSEDSEDVPQSLEETEKETSPKQETEKSLPVVGEPDSDRDLYDDTGIKQRRHYGPDGRAEYDVDFRHGGNNHKFPHIHYWNWNNIPPRGPAINIFIMYKRK